MLKLTIKSTRHLQLHVYELNLLNSSKRSSGYHRIGRATAILTTRPCYFTQVHLHTIAPLSHPLSVHHTGSLPSSAITVNTTVYGRFFQVTPINVDIAVLQEKQALRLSVGESSQGLSKGVKVKIGGKITSATFLKAAEKYCFRLIKNVVLRFTSQYFVLIQDRIPEKQKAFQGV